MARFVGPDGISGYLRARNQNLGPFTALQEDALKVVGKFGSFRHSKDQKCLRPHIHRLRRQGWVVVQDEDGTYFAAMQEGDAIYVPGKWEDVRRYASPGQAQNEEGQREMERHEKTPGWQVAEAQVKQALKGILPSNQPNSIRPGFRVRYNAQHPKWTWEVTVVYDDYTYLSRTSAQRRLDALLANSAAVRGDIEQIWVVGY